jgi:hypothetical protein
MELRQVAAPGLGTGPGTLPKLATHVGMLLAALAFASWWTSHTILDTARTRRVADAVLENANVRHFVASEIASINTPAVGAGTVSAATGTTRTADPALSAQRALGTQLDAVLDRPDIRAKLENFVVDAHDVLIGVSTKPAVLDQQTTRALVAAALPTLSAADLAKVHEVRFSVPNVGALSNARKTLAHRFWLYCLGAIALLAFAIATTRDRRSTLRLIGRWLIGISIVHIVVLWILPVMVVPVVSTSPWADLIAAVARALSAGIITGLIVLAAVGVAFLFADHLVKPGSTAPSPKLAADTAPET